MSKTPRTDTEVTANGIERCVATDREMWKPYVSADFARQLETELNEAKAYKSVTELAADHPNLLEYLAQLEQQLREARANAFDEAAEVASANGAVETHRDLKRKAAAIRKGEEK